jgi:septal ring factor EnvC (AmiA/AmiB activator)
VILMALLVAAPVAAQRDTVQQRIRASQERLDQIRAERAELERQMTSLQGTARDISAELRNIERQVETSAATVRELDFQTAALAAAVEENRRRLVIARDRLTERKVVLEKRLRSIYRRGPLHAVRVLLTAESFGDLLNRYKYLHLISVHDRVLLEEIQGLEGELARRERDLAQNLSQIEGLRAEKMGELARLQQLEQSRGSTLRQVRSRVSQAEGRLQQLAEDEKRLTDVIASLERARLAAERRGAVGPGALSSADLGSLRWPLDGPVIYQFGPERRPNGVTLRRNGIGIGARTGTPVRAVEAGTVMVADVVEGFGRGVVLSHGSGFYTLYLYLGEIHVQTGQDVPAGQVLGTVGSATPEDPPHLYFRLLTPVPGQQAPAPVDPLPWLAPRS